MLGQQAKAAGARASELEADLSGKDAALKALMLKLPGIPYDGAPVGPDETFNTVVRQEGKVPSFDFEPLDHAYQVKTPHLTSPCVRSSPRRVPSGRSPGVA